MARKVETIVTLTDDLDGGKAEITINFAFDGTNYEIDLSAKNAKKMKDLFGPYVSAARKTPKPTSNRRPGSASPTRRDASQSKATREWARSNGWPDLGERGRIPVEIEDAYNAAH